MRNLLLLMTAMAFVSTTAASYGQTAATPDPLAIGGKDTAWFLDRVGRPDTDSEPQAPFKIMGNVYYVGANNIASILVATVARQRSTIRTDHNRRADGRKGAPYGEASATKHSASREDAAIRFVWSTNQC